MEKTQTETGNLELQHENMTLTTLLKQDKLIMNMSHNIFKTLEK